MEPKTTCDHDWRVDPGVVLTSNPPSQRLVCAKCWMVSYRTAPGAQVRTYNRNIESWPKA